MPPVNKNGSPIAVRGNEGLDHERISSHYLYRRGVLLSVGCATHKYVRNTAAPIQAKLDQVGEQASKNDQSIEDTNQAVQSADQANRGLTSLRQVVANIDDYKLQSSATVPFKFNQYVLTTEAQEDLDKLAEGIKGSRRYFVAVEGYTDDVGNKRYNEQLSRRRADNVAEYLVAKHDIPIYRIHMIGLGEEKPVDDGHNRAARAKNRRVEVKVFTADQVTASLGGSDLAAR